MRFYLVQEKLSQKVFQFSVVFIPPMHWQFNLIFPDLIQISVYMKIFLGSIFSFEKHILGFKIKNQEVGQFCFGEVGVVVRECRILRSIVNQNA
jgi:hypothetical protein